ncbi:Site-specific recombinase XerD [Sphingobium sp. YR768]|nr:Site-specific recombinase XerD [Sphingobium sp. YR768]
MISEGLHLGYYRGARGGTWVARYRPAGGDSHGTKRSLGTADDIVLANGDTVLNWKQALDKATEWFELQESDGNLLNANITVKDSVEAFIAMRDQRQSLRVGHPSRSTANMKLTPHVLKDEALVLTKLRDLTEAHLRSWQRRLREGLRGSSKMRVVSELKAALNATFEEHRKALPKDFGLTIKFGLKPVFPVETVTEPLARQNQVLSDRQIRDVLAKARELDKDGDHARMAILLAATGARFSQLARMRVADVQPELNRVLIPVSHKGRGQKAASFIRMQVGRDVVEALRPAFESRKPEEVLLERWHYRQTDSITWIRASRQPWKTPSEMRRWWQKVMDALGQPNVIPYALRHSSIVRAISAGLPIRLVAALHDTSTAMIEKHYARWITESLDDFAARAIIPLVDVEQAHPPSNQLDSVMDRRLKNSQVNGCSLE